MLTQVSQRMSWRQMPLSSAGEWAAVPRECLRSQVAETGPSTPPFRRESTESTRRQPPTLSAYKSGPFWVGISPFQAASLVSGSGVLQTMFRVWNGTSNLTVWILLPQARRWSWSGRWCWRCTRRRLRSFIKNWGARQPLTTRCLPNRAALPHHLSDLFQASAHACKKKTNKQTNQTPPKTSPYVLLVLSQFVGVVQRKTNVSHCKKAL